MGGTRKGSLAGKVAIVTGGGSGIGAAIARRFVAEGSAHYVARAMQRYGGVDVLVSNAGIDGPFKPITHSDVAEFDEVMAINVRGVWLSVQHTLPAMVARGGGSVVLMSSVWALQATTDEAGRVVSHHNVIVGSPGTELEFAL